MIFERPRFIHLGGLLVALGAGGCSSDDSCQTCGADPIDASAGAGQDGSVATDGSPAITDFGQPGPFDVSSQSLTASASCSMSYVLYEPAGASSPPLVVLGHGFMRSAAQMVEVAEHIASYGARVATPDFCTTSDHAQNGADAAALSAELAGGRPVIHAGYSAGGLAAVVAAAEDTGAVAVLGLDMVDSDGLGAGTAASMTLPFFGTAGEPGSCNSQNNGVPVFSGSGRLAVRIKGATHCDFEAPTGVLCEGFCGAATGKIAIVKTLSAAFVAWQTGIDPSGESFTTAGGAALGDLVTTGTVEIL